MVQLIHLYIPGGGLEGTVVAGVGATVGAGCVGGDCCGCATGCCGCVVGSGLRSCGAVPASVVAAS